MKKFGMGTHRHRSCDAYLLHLIAGWFLLCLFSDDVNYTTYSIRAVFSTGSTLNNLLYVQRFCTLTVALRLPHQSTYQNHLVLVDHLQGSSVTRFCTADGYTNTAHSINGSRYTCLSKYNVFDGLRLFLFNLFLGNDLHML